MGQRCGALEVLASARILRQWVGIAGLDVGERRIGVAVSDATRMLARPVGVVRTSGPDVDALERAAAAPNRLAAEEDGVTSLVVGLPRRLDGSPNAMTPLVEDSRRHSASGGIAGLLAGRATDAASRPRAVWRDAKRIGACGKKARCAAAAIILQDYLDSQS